ncbi:MULTISPECIES: LysE family translocator [Rhizobium/Agrobacterium group]|uniref:LysE family translocator n=1 Tax=Rhizobium/Agrobacterium group TaxID=227290 RepID=UPI0008DC0DB3|nr:MULTISPECIES: LysE family translocator [Rhizobium/Agrobacterium group]OHZ40765.1 hypothetical protein BBL07_09925 [Agrobacterium vitis]
MDTGWYASLIGFAFAMAATPGPNNTMATASGANYGLMRTLPLMSGIAVGVAVIMFIVAVFGASVVAEPRVYLILKWVGIAYLFWIAWQIASAEPKLADADPMASCNAKPLSFTQGILLQFVNPKLWVMATGAIVAHGHVSEQIGYAVLGTLFAFVFGALTFISTVAWAGLGAYIGRLLVSPQIIRVFNLTMALLLVLSLIPIIFH